MFDKPVQRVLIAVVAAAFVLTSWPAEAQSLAKVREIRNNPKTYANEMVTIEGFATQWVEGKSRSTNFYFLKDDWGSVIKVRTSKEPPEVGERYRVTGGVGIDPTSHNDVYVAEEMRIHVRDEVETQPEVVTVPEVADEVPTAIPEEVFIEEDFGGMTDQTKILIGAIVAVVVVLLVLLIALTRSKKSAATDPMDVAAPSSDPPPTGTGAGDPEPEVVEGRTIKMHAPPPGTLKILPGRLEIAAGDDTVKEIRFYRVRGQSTPEITFGRAAGAPYSHIQLKPMTVSSRQAKITYINNAWILTNFAPDTSNPTRFNGVELPVDGQTELHEGDKIEMGEVVMIFHES